MEQIWKVVIVQHSFKFEVNFMKNLNKQQRLEEWFQRDSSAQKKYKDQLENSFVNDLELIKESQ